MIYGWYHKLNHLNHLPARPKPYGIKEFAQKGNERNETKQWQVWKIVKVSELEVSIIWEFNIVTCEQWSKWFTVATKLWQQ